MKITAIEIKPGMIIEHKNDYWNVLKTQHVKPGKGGAFNQVELKSVIKGTKLNERFRSSETVEKAEVDEKKFNFLYLEGDSCHFMDNNTYEQVQVDSLLMDDGHFYIKEGDSIEISFDNEEIIGLLLPPKTILKVIQTDPGHKGNTATNALKPATLETGLEVQVPLFINEGDLVKIHTKDGSYSERVKQ